MLVEVPMRIVFLSQGPTFEASSAPFRLLRNYAFRTRELAANCEFVHFPLAAHSLVASDRRQSQPNDFYSLAEQVLSLNPDVIAISLYCWNTSALLEIARICKSSCPALRVVAGGPDTYARGSALLEENSFVDVVIDSEGEYSFACLLQLWQMGSAPRLGGSSDLVAIARLAEQRGGIENIPFTSYRVDGQVRRSRGEHFVTDLDEIPSPILGQTREDLVTRFYREEDEAVIVETSRGCPVNCAFCQYPKNFDGRMRYYSVERVLSELRHIRSLGIRRVYFADGIFSIRKERAEAILRHFIDEFQEGSIHIELKLDMLPDALMSPIRTLLSESRLSAGIGVQSTKKETLDRIGRPTKLALVTENVRRLGSPASARWDLIYGLPGDSFEDFIAGLDYVYANAPGATIALQRLQVLPGTDMWANSARYGLLFERHDPYWVIKSDTFSAVDVLKASAASMAYRLFEPVIRLAVDPLGMGYHFDDFWRDVFCCAEGDDGLARQNLANSPAVYCWALDRIRYALKTRVSERDYEYLVEVLEAALIRFAVAANQVRALKAASESFGHFYTRLPKPEIGRTDDQPLRLTSVIDRAWMFKFHRQVPPDLGRDSLCTSSRSNSQDPSYWILTADYLFELSEDQFDVVLGFQRPTTIDGVAECLERQDSSWKRVDREELATLVEGFVSEGVLSPDLALSRP